LRPTPYNVLATRALKLLRDRKPRDFHRLLQELDFSLNTQAARAYAIIILNIYNIENDHHVMKSSKEPHDTYKE
jgi:hypothetical protein